MTSRDLPYMGLHAAGLFHKLFARTMNVYASPTTPVSCSERPAKGRERVHLTIEYCEMGSYVRPARRLAAEVFEEFRDCDIHLELVPSSGGVFEVSVGGRLVYSKKATGRLPGADEIFYHVGVAARAAQRTA